MTVVNFKEYSNNLPPKRLIINQKGLEAAAFGITSIDAKDGMQYIGAGKLVLPITYCNGFLHYLGTLDGIFLISYVLKKQKNLDSMGLRGTYGGYELEGHFSHQNILDFTDADFDLSRNTTLEIKLE